ncbi:hypothetical protein J8A87_26800 [Vibrio parahaemolyticus]|nr:MULTISPECIES: hypothetical protein [Vibrio]EGQ8302054.1 hypothetical protein [Vibrio parahaemolyticus]EGQ8891822.1 hypothetical protein [Vibrio parahaemolyticus]MBE4202322.1 hypothetical protein [Vibrio parahaemolyticus]MBE4779256.1 hypothetical protein [Vibrio parahaemolyticus]MCF9168040.1 hypothetical protein [Vibrio parahaemolyticus]
MTNKFKNMKNKILPILAGIVLTASCAQASEWESFINSDDVYIKFGGWSKHVTESFDKYEYNESHNGIGLEWTFFKSENKKHNLSLGYFHMKDSFDMDNKQGGIIYTYKPDTGYYILDNINYNLALMVMERGWIHRSKPYYNNYYFTTEVDPVALPYLTYNITDYLNVDIMYIPQFDEAMPKSTFFIRGGFKLNKINDWL